jgi:hypothetical protein
MLYPKGPWTECQNHYYYYHYYYYYYYIVVVVVIIIIIIIKVRDNVYLTRCCSMKTYSLLN